MECRLDLALGTQCGPLAALQEDCTLPEPLLIQRAEDTEGSCTQGAGPHIKPLKAVGVTASLNSPGDSDSSLFIAQISPKVVSTLDKRRKLATFKNILPLSHSNTSSLLKYLGVIS